MTAVLQEIKNKASAINSLWARSLLSRGFSHHFYKDHHYLYHNQNHNHHHLHIHQHHHNRHFCKRIWLGYSIDKYLFSMSKLKANQNDGDDILKLEATNPKTKPPWSQNICLFQLVIFPVKLSIDRIDLSIFNNQLEYNSTIIWEL